MRRGRLSARLTGRRERRKPCPVSTAPSFRGKAEGKAMSRRSINEWRELIEEQARPKEKLSLDEQFKRGGINHVRSLNPSSFPPIEAIRKIRKLHQWMQSMIYRRVPWLYELKEEYRGKVEETLNVVGLDFGRIQAICGLIVKIPDEAILSGDEMEEALETLENELGNRNEEARAPDHAHRGGVVSTAKLSQEIKAPAVAQEITLVELLTKVTEETGIEKWASSHHFSRTAVFDWKKAGCQPVQGKVSPTKSNSFSQAVREDAAALGLLSSD
jgi:hypothetical protein